MKKKYMLVLSVLLFVTAVSGQNVKKALMFDDFIALKRISDPQISPDGKVMAVVVTEMDKKNNKSNSDIWLIPLTEGKPWKLTSSPAADYNPIWAPCGKKIAFISTRSGSPQIWKINPKGGEASQMTDISAGVSGLIWSPAKTHIGFVSDVEPKNSNTKTFAPPIKAEIFDELLFRHWNAWRHGKRSHFFVIPAKGGQAQDITPGDFDTPPISLGGNQDYVFSPDGKEVCFTRNIDPELRKGLGTNNDLFIRDLSKDSIQKITTSRANDNSPLYSPDGRYIAFKAMKRPGFEADKYVLVIYDRSQKSMRRLTDSLDLSVGEILWAKDSSSLFFTCGAKGRTELYTIDLKTNDPHQVLSGHTMDSIRLSPDGLFLYFLKQAINMPRELFSLDLKTSAVKQITRFNEKLLSGLEMNPLEEFWFKGAEGDKVHGLLLKPPFFDGSKKYPLVMLFHGGPQGAWTDDFHFRWNAQMFAAPGYVVAMINFHGSTGYGQDFTDSISGDWGGKPYKDILASLDHLFSTNSFIDRNKVGAAGASYGGYMINWIEGHTDRFSCLISHAGVYDLRSMYGATEELWFPEWEYEGTPWSNPEQYEKWSPSSFVQNFKTPCLVIHGQHDFRVPVTQGFQLFTALQRMNVPSRMLYFPDEYHFVTKPLNAELWWNTMFDWLAKYLK